MTHKLTLNRENPVIHLKAYGGVQIKGVDDAAEVTCEIRSSELATMVEENGHVYVTANASCSLTVPSSSSIVFERGMGSVKIENIQGQVDVEKVLGNLVLSDVGEAAIDKVGGNLSIRNTAGQVRVEKVAGTLVADRVESFRVDKVGGSCYIRDVKGDFSLEKAGGTFLGQSLMGLTSVSKIGGDFKAWQLQLGDDLKTGGSIELGGVDFSGDLSLKAGGDIELGLKETVDDVAIEVQSGSQDIRVKSHQDQIEVKDHAYEHQIGEKLKTLSVSAGGSVTIKDFSEADQDLVGDLDGHFEYEESAFSEMIQERIDSATRRAEAKVKAAEIRLEQIREQVAKQRGVNIDLGFGSSGEEAAAGQPPVSRPGSKKGATDEERLMILKMLQDGKIKVEEAETLFQALED